MMKHALTILIAAAGVVFAADPTPLNLKPGLWETTTVTERSGAGMPSIPPDALAKLPPEQRARIEAMAGGKPVTNTRQSCRTDKDLHPFTDSRANQSCKMTYLTSTPSKQEIQMDCSMGGMPATGTVTLEVKDSQHVAGQVVLHANANGRQMDTKITINAKWLGSDCGSVKPLSEK